MPPTIVDIQQAAERIRPHAHRTPVLTCSYLNEQIGANIYLKCEHLQKVGAFKFRGACNAVFSLRDDEAARGVATHSSGNHAQALALAARLRGIPAYIVMPSNSPAVKQAAVAGYGGQITLCEPTLAARESTLASVVAATGATVVHPYDDDRVIAGQGTATLELLADVPQLEMIVAPVGGGGLICGTALAAKGISPSVRVIAAEPELADDAFRSLESGVVQPPRPPLTIADGLRAALSERTFAIIRQHVEQIIPVSETGIITGMRMIWERAKQVIEPSAGVGIAALLERQAEFAGKHVGVILCGGNVDLDRLPWQVG
ncbi:pyridoxal-phosphate dependent enzyme [Tuwongella immobilis]|uniref:Tryptophan synthase beta chain-like PALP domain-containing protein n=1 Tax=Tuwongella immobilis TaxID=692036 RepID=A0A6C2YTU7_9BACT|nr:pyridoxal-phosphate dependent enzyme [Tuwongella immobilis]VIP04553.1 serine dehydratase : Serine dehydratase OS=Chlorobium sp. GBChlB GN=HY22_00065 PE=4 SV=1: PALP [Tuwongella immobilis]VTS06467.1 serine dehydratase : Serine dehydratase OS=Chlorobium sp. GBChlB GN=HY22_00065 PE=4 SV=1: PALP [Tuwongella immobilis]